MPKGRVASWWRAVSGPLLSSPRRLWWTTFVLVTAVGGLWALANPLFAAPDENSHVVRAVALDHGQLTGKEQKSLLRQHLDVTPEALEVRVPAIYRDEGSACFAFRPNTTAECAHVEGSSRDVETLTSAGRHPPSYYAVVGIASWLYHPGSGVVYLMRFFSVLIMAAFLATTITALRRTALPRVVAVGVLFAITPMVLFVGSSVNPNGPEIAAAVAFWVCALVLLSNARDGIDRRLVTAAGIAGCALALSRQLGPLWLALIGITVAVFAGWESIRALARSGWARFWTALIVVFSAAQVAWDIGVGSLGYTKPPNAAKNIPTADIARFTVGAMFDRYKQMIGYFGWLDTQSPALTYVLWTAGLGFLVLVALAFARRRQVAALFIVIAATVVVPVTLESAVFGKAGGAAWQGRYGLPLAVGVPIVAAMAIASGGRGRQLAEPRLFIGAGVMLVVAHFLAFAQNLRRYTVGYDGEIQYWRHPAWSPPLSPLILTIVYALVVTAFVGWFLYSVSPRGEEAEDRAERPVPATAQAARPRSEARTAPDTA